jgi:hypothetical protein
MPHSLAARIQAGLTFAGNRLHTAGDESGQGTVEYVGLAMSVGILLLAVGSFLSGKDHGIGTVITGALKAAIQQASGASK